METPTLISLLEEILSLLKNQASETESEEIEVEPEKEKKPKNLKKHKAKTKSKKEKEKPEPEKGGEITHDTVIRVAREKVQDGISRAKIFSVIESTGESSIGEASEENLQIIHDKLSKL